MTLYFFYLHIKSRYLTDKTTPEEIEKAKESGIVFACKYYPAGATTNSDNGVTDIHNVYPVLVYFFLEIKCIEENGWSKYAIVYS